MDNNMGKISLGIEGISSISFHFILSVIERSGSRTLRDICFPTRVRRVEG